jgi:hypothetical protein
MTTAVEWLVEQIIKENGLLHLDLEAAKEMEKQQIIDAFCWDVYGEDYRNDGEQYYNKTFKSE